MGKRLAFHLEHRHEAKRVWRSVVETTRLWVKNELFRDLRKHYLMARYNSRKKKQIVLNRFTRDHINCDFILKVNVWVQNFFHDFVFGVNSNF